MTSAGAYLAGAVELAVIAGSLGLAAVRLRRRLLPAWAGAPARLAEAIAGVGMAVLAAELLGAAGVLHEGTYLAAAAAVGAGSVALGPGAHREPLPEAPRVAGWQAALALGVGALVFLHWGTEVAVSLEEGIGNFDSLWYHMPFAAEFAQSGSATRLVFTDPLFINWFYPQNSELLHGVALLVWERDTLSLFLNLGWLAVALVSAWCIGRPFGRGPHALVAVAILLEAHTLVVREPGAAKNDIVGTALVLAAVALLVTAYSATRGPGRGRGIAADPGALALGGLAAGLAVGTKLTVAAPIAALTVAVVVLAPSGRRLAALGTWGLPMIAGGAFWYVRNLVAAGNPLPWVRELGPLSLPGPERLQEARPDFAVVHYATDTKIWGTWFFTELEEAFGLLWPALLAAALAGAVLVLWRGEPWLRALGVVAIVAMVAYLLTPLGAAGPEGMPRAFGINLRFAVPGLALGLALLPLVPALRGARAGPALLVALLALLLVSDEPWQLLESEQLWPGLAIAAVVAFVPGALVLAARAGRLSRGGLPAGLVAVAAIALALGYPVQRSYLDDRWRHFGSAQDMDGAYRWAQDVRDSRIALAGTTAAFNRYAFYGEDLSNEVTYIGRELFNRGFAAIPDCDWFIQTVRQEDFDYVVTAPFLNFDDATEPIYSPEGDWMAAATGASQVMENGPVTVWEVDGRLTNECWRANDPRYLPEQVEPGERVPPARPPRATPLRINR